MIKSALQRWLEISPVLKHECVHVYGILEKKQVETLFRFPPDQIGSFEFPCSDQNTYKRIKTQYILQCKHCGELKEEIL